MSLTRAVALDCEMVIGQNGKFLPAQVAIVNEYGRELCNTYIRQTDVKDYLTWITGITEDHLRNGRDYEDVKRDIEWIMVGRLLVGHDLSKDLKCLGLSHPESDKRDTAVFFKNDRGFQRLKKLALEHLGLSIQNGRHDALEDANACMMLYKKFEDEWENSMLVLDRFSDSLNTLESRSFNRYNISKYEWESQTSDTMDDILDNSEFQGVFSYENLRQRSNALARLRFGTSSSLAVTKLPYRSTNTISNVVNHRGLSHYKFHQDQSGRFIYTDTQVGSSDSWLRDIGGFCITVLQFCFAVFILLFMLFFVLVLVENTFKKN